MNKYDVKLLPRAYQDLDQIYAYIAKSLESPNAAKNLINEIEQAILSLEQMPWRGAIRNVGAYANAGYRQLFVKNYILVYRVNITNNEVLIVTVRYYANNF